MINSFWDIWTLQNDINLHVSIKVMKGRSLKLGQDEEFKYKVLCNEKIATIKLKMENFKTQFNCKKRGNKENSSQRV